ncbi:XRE family transcriptional regulator [Brevibacillus laterosporus]|nr:helix-turn-helix transcriptional regulator [Brevibacillus laterosporus]TPG68928.1 XRE family transcriptional regulator [Brevibacillus laterosporus]
MLTEILAKLRTTKKITQADLAKKLGIARTTYAGYENGSRKPDPDTLQKLADVFEVSVDYLLGRTDNPTNINKSGYHDDDLCAGLAFSHGGKEKLTEEEEDYLRVSLEIFRKMKEKKKKDQ